MYDILIVATHKYGEPARVHIERQDDFRAYGFIRDQGNQPVSINRKAIGYVGDQPVVKDEDILHERGF